MFTGLIWRVSANTKLLRSILCDIVWIGFVPILLSRKLFFDASKHGSYYDRFCVGYVVLWQANVDFDQFPARECVTGLVILRIKPLALLPLAGPSHSLYTNVALRSSRVLAVICTAGVQATHYGGVHRMDCICLFIHWTQGMAVFAPATANDACFGCRIHFPAGARPGSETRKAWIASFGYSVATNCHHIDFVVVDSSIYLCCALPLYRANCGHVLLEATSCR